MNRYFVFGACDYHSDNFREEMNFLGHRHRHNYFEGLVMILGKI